MDCQWVGRLRQHAACQGRQRTRYSCSVWSFLTFFFFPMVNCLRASNRKSMLAVWKVTARKSNRMNQSITLCFWPEFSSRGTNSGDPEKGGSGDGPSVLTVVVANVVIAGSMVLVLQFGTLHGMALFTANNDVSLACTMACCTSSSSSSSTTTSSSSAIVRTSAPRRTVSTWRR